MLYSRTERQPCPQASCANRCLAEPWHGLLPNGVTGGRGGCTRACTLAQEMELATRLFIDAPFAGLLCRHGPLKSILALLYIIAQGVCGVGHEIQPGKQ